MPYSKQEVVAACLPLAEGRLINVTLSTWLDLEISEIIHRKRYWWRRKSFTLTTVAGTATYDVSASGLNLADNLEQIINVYRVSAGTDPAKINFEGDENRVQNMLASTTQADPAFYLIEPGTTHTLRFSDIPNAAKDYRILYWAGHNPSLESIEEAIPLIPPAFHYVALLALTKRIFQFLFGLKDNRYVVAEKDLERALEKLDGYQAVSMEHVTEFRTTDSRDTVRATS